MTHAPTYLVPLQVAPLLSAAMAASTEHIQLGMAVLSSMVLLGGLPFLQQYGQVWGDVGGVDRVWLVCVRGGEQVWAGAETAHKCGLVGEC